MPEVAENGTYALLTARHIDDLTEAVRAQTTNQAIANELTRTQTGAVKALTAALDRLILALAPKVTQDAASDVALDEATAGPEDDLLVPRTSSQAIPR